MSVENDNIGGGRSRRDVVLMGENGAPSPVLDPLAYEFLQRYMDAERQRSRRLLVWTATIFLFASLLLFIVFVSIGIVVLGNSRRAVEAVDAVKAQGDARAGDVAAIGKRLVRVEDTGEQIRKSVRERDVKQEQSDDVLRNDLERFGKWVAANNASDRHWISRIEMRIKDLEEALKAKEGELASVRKGPPQERGANAPATVAAVPGSRDVPMQTNELPDTISLDELTNTVFDAAITVVEGGPRGEISVVTFPNGDRYEGEFKNGLCDGWGAYTHRNGDRYEGEFRNDMKQGKGTFTYRNGEKYIGAFAHDMKNGRGTFMFKDGSRYVGEFKNDMIDGKGTMHYSNRNRYSGDFLRGLKHGNGIFMFGNGDAYKGEFKDDLRNGRGVYVFNDGTRYIGQFRDGKRHGAGRLIYNTGEEYAGDFRDGRRDGKGTCIYSNGERVSGEWKDDKFIRATETEPPRN